ncbi:MAG: 3-dehydroquinate synthase [Chitinispirillales bacterium]|jgi:3-dehydroquinate synthase|nr:3-dehydroquinate synthase [Chitinispirillales bacterium]
MKLSVSLAKRSYPIFINEKIDFYSSILEFCPATKYIIVTNDTILKIYENHLSDWKRNLPDSSIIVIPDGEKYKNMKTLNYILDEALKLECDRKSVMIAFGGGVVGDITGFAASVLLRGINYIQIPTTLLAAVDSGVGGKTAVNNSIGKNLIGSFWQPKMVWIDTKYLDTLPDREFIAGCGEIAKYGYIGQKRTFEFITQNFEKICNRSNSEMQEAIVRSIKIKTDIVSRDETETGERALLNFGHTFAHAFEKIYGYGTLLHGEAVMLGINCAVKLATRMNLIKKERAKILNQSLKILRIPEIPHKISANSIYRAMNSDKKKANGKLKFVLPTSIGKSKILDNVNKKDVISVLDEVFDSWIF